MLEDRALVEQVYEAQGPRRPQSRSRGREQTPDCGNARTTGEAGAGRRCRAVTENASQLLRLARQICDDMQGVLVEVSRLSPRRRV